MVDFKELRIISDRSWGFLVVTKETDSSYMCVCVESVLADGRFVPNLDVSTGEKHTIRKYVFSKGVKKPHDIEWFGYSVNNVVYYRSSFYKFDKLNNDYRLTALRLSSDDDIKAIVCRLDSTLSLSDLIARKEIQFKRLIQDIYGDSLNKVNRDTSYTSKELMSFCQGDMELYNLWLDLKFLYSLVKEG